MEEGGVVQAVAIVLSISYMSDCLPVTSNLPTDKKTHIVPQHILYLGRSRLS